jgi:hypothetical protein
VYKVGELLALLKRDVEGDYIWELKTDIWEEEWDHLCVSMSEDLRQKTVWPSGSFSAHALSPPQPLLSTNCFGLIAFHILRTLKTLSGNAATVWTFPIPMPALTKCLWSRKHPNRQWQKHLKGGSYTPSISGPTHGDYW